VDWGQGVWGLLLDERRCSLLKPAFLQAELC